MFFGRENAGSPDYETISLLLRRQEQIEDYILAAPAVGHQISLDDERDIVKLVSCDDVLRKLLLNENLSRSNH